MFLQFYITFPSPLRFFVFTFLFLTISVFGAYTYANVRRENCPPDKFISFAAKAQKGVKMKLLKKILIGAVFMTAGFAFAQTSMMKISTANLFGNDVDDFMSVNDWQNVQPKNMFGYLGYGQTGKSNIELGLSRMFDPFYMGAWFGGSVGWTSKTDSGGNINNNTKDPTADNNRAAHGKVIFGINNLGFLADVRFKPNAGNKYEKSGAIETTANKFELDTTIRAGMNIPAGEKLFKTSAALGLRSKADKEETKNDGKITTLTDKGYTILDIDAGVSFDFYKKGAVTQNAALALDTDWTFFPIDTAAGGVNTKTFGQANNKIALEPRWELTFEPDARFAFKMGSGVNMALRFESDYNYSESSGTKTYNTNRNHKTTLFFMPDLELGMSYFIVPAKFRFNAGASFIMADYDSATKKYSPSIGWTFTRNETRNSSNGSVTSSSGATEWKFDNQTGKVQLSSGFTWYLSKNVTADVYWNLLGNVFDAFGSKLLEGNGISILNTMNQLLIHNFGVLIAVKF